MNRTNFTGFYGWKVRLTCKATAEKEPKIVWFKKDSTKELFGEITNKSVFSFQNSGRVLEVRVSVDTIGSYMCKACNDDGCAEKNMTLSWLCK